MGEKKLGCQSLKDFVNALAISRGVWASKHFFFLLSSNNRMLTCGTTSYWWSDEWNEGWGEEIFHFRSRKGEGENVRVISLLIFYSFFFFLLSFLFILANHRRKRVKTLLPQSQGTLLVDLKQLSYNKVDVCNHAQHSPRHSIRQRRIHQFWSHNFFSMQISYLPDIIWLKIRRRN